MCFFSSIIQTCITAHRAVALGCRGRKLERKQSRILAYGDTVNGPFRESRVDWVSRVGAEPVVGRETDMFRYGQNPPPFGVGDPHQIDFNSDPNRTYGFTTPRSHPSLFTSRPPLTPAPDPQLLKSPQPTTCPISPVVEIPAEPPIPAVPYVMELHVVTKTKGKTGRGKAAEEFRAKKPPINLSLHQTYVQFLTSVAKVADVKQSQLDREHMRWKHQKPATSPPVSVSDEESFSIMIQAI